MCVSEAIYLATLWTSVNQEIRHPQNKKGQPLPKTLLKYDGGERSLTGIEYKEESNQISHRNLVKYAKLHAGVFQQKP